MKIKKVLIGLLALVTAGEVIAKLNSKEGKSK